jgi:hypothetical protein
VLRAVAAISLLYDLTAGILLLFFRSEFQHIFGLPVVQPAIYADLNAIFLIAIGVGYVMPLRDPARHRGYMWIAGVLLKTGGAVAFVIEYSYRAGPAAMLLFALSDGALAVASLITLLRASRRLADAAIDSGTTNRSESRQG